MFAEIARRYDLLNHLLSLGIDRRWRRRAVALLAPVDDAPILDVCTGTADLALAFRRFRPTIRPIVGADFCRPMLAVGLRKCRRAGVDNHIALVEADALGLPFRDGAFQIVSVAFGLRNLADTDQGLREMARVCRRGGRVAILEFSAMNSPIFGRLYRWYFRAVLPRVGQWLARNRSSAYNYLPSSVEEFCEGEALAQRMRAAGMTRVERHRFTFGIATLYIGTKP